MMKCYEKTFVVCVIFKNFSINIIYVILSIIYVYHYILTKNIFYINGFICIFLSETTINLKIIFYVSVIVQILFLPKNSLLSKCPSFAA